MMCSLHVSLHPDHSRDSVATTNQKQPFEFTTARLVVDEPADVRWTLLAFQPAAMADERELWLEDVDLVSLSLSFSIIQSRDLGFCVSYSTLHTWCIFLNSFILSLLYTHIDKRRKKLCVYSHNSALSGCECAVMVFLPIHIVGERERWLLAPSTKIEDKTTNIEKGKGSSWTWAISMQPGKRSCKRVSCNPVIAFTFEASFLSCWQIFSSPLLLWDKEWEWATQVKGG